jgi:hypothetical protein
MGPDYLSRAIRTMLCLAFIGSLGCPIEITAGLSGVVFVACLISVLYSGFQRGDTELHLGPHALVTYKPNWRGRSRKTHHILLHEIRSVVRAVQNPEKITLVNDRWIQREEEVRLVLEDARRLSLPLPLERTTAPEHPDHQWPSKGGPASRFMEELESAVSAAHEGTIDAEALAQLNQLVAGIPGRED